jgi:CubicO group peptidase (beta-lactamase class C family)
MGLTTKTTMRAQRKSYGASLSFYKETCWQTLNKLLADLLISNLFKIGMKKFFFILSLLLTAKTLFGQQPGKSIDFKKIEITILAELKEKQAAGGAVAIVSGDKIIFAKGFGVANAEIGNSVTPDTLFQSGSITKTFTALATLGFADEGKINLYAPIGDYAKGLSPKISKVTFAELLSHTGGILDEPDEYGAQDESLMATYLRSWKDNYCLFEPGQVFSYSNSGFALAGFALQEVAQKSYIELMNERVFQPLGMTRTTFRPTVAMTYPLAVGHKKGEKPMVVRPLPNDARLYPAGTFYTSANDLARFAAAFLNDGKLDGKQIISPSIVKQMSQPHASVTSSVLDLSYGYGLFINSSRGVRRVWHDGSMTGYVAQMMLVPEHRFAVIVLSNTDGTSLDKTLDAAMEMMLPLTSRETKTKIPQSINEAEMQKYVGTYEQPNRWKIEIFSKEGKLFIRQFEREMPLTKIAENRFSFQFPPPIVTQEITFTIGKEGKIVSLNQFVWAFKRL